MSKPVILVIEDQKSMADLLTEQLKEQSGYEVLVAYNYSQAQNIIESRNDIVVCMTDLNLPDAPEGATVGLLQDHHITTVVLTGNYTDEARQKMYKQRVADYVIKDGMAAINYAIKTVVNLVENAQHSIWVLTPQTKNSKRLVGLLNIHRYRVSVFEDAKILKETLKSKSPDLLLMNETSMLEDFSRKSFVQDIRHHYTQNQLPVIISEESVEIFEVIRLMKYGVNDFYNHTFTVEELYVRLQMNISLALSYRKIEKISQTDPLTGLANRRFFFEKSREIISGNSKAFAVMFDIDFFKKVNDTYGHDKGDEAIIYTANMIKTVFKDFLVARFGGEEFCAFGSFTHIDEVLALCEKVRNRIENESESAIDVPINISGGVAYTQSKVEDLITGADQALYESKNSGRNQITLNA